MRAFISSFFYKGEICKMTTIMILLIKTILAILFAILEGNGAVWFFNRMPPKWFCDYGEEPTEEILSTDTQRVKSYPWKFSLTMLFVVVNVRLVMVDAQFAIAATLALWLLLEISISDLKYRIIPDELLILLAVCGLGFYPFHSNIKSCIFGALVGFGIVAFLSLISKMAYKRDAIGGGDVKLFAVLGFLTEPEGVIAIFIMSSFISAMCFSYLLLRRKIKRNDTFPMAPYIAVAAGIYFMFLWDAFDIIKL